ncbi:MAG: hypothetical protein HWN68_18155 [Desulfobacterales bacterium]|nr:hypothetical protein [Desulfobacterales bacterium]
MNKNLILIRELRTKEKFLDRQKSDIRMRIRELKKQYFDADEEKEFTFELLEAILTDYLTNEQIKEVVKNFEISFERLELVLADYLTEEQIKEVIDKLKEI